MQTKFVLEIIYEPWLSKNPEKREDIKRLFCDTLGIPNCTVEIYVEELKSIRDSGSEDSDIFTTVYKALDSLWQSDIAKELTGDWLRRQFDNHSLIYVASNEGPSWRKTSQCVWSTAARLRDMVSLNSDYEELHDFFVNALGVRPVTLSMAIDELKQAGGRQSVSIEEVKASLLTVNSLLCSESDPQQPELMESNIFPVRYPDGGVKCVSAQTQFFIVDRKSLRTSFEDRVKFLDFSLEEVVRLGPFLSWTGLENRSISQSVREFTSIQDSCTHPISKYGLEFRYRAHALLRYVPGFHMNLEQAH